MSTPAAASDRPTLGSFWQDLPREGKYLLSTIIVEALAKQLDARVEVVRNPKGTTVSITHGTSDPAWPPLTGSTSLTGSGGRWFSPHEGCR